MDLDAVKKVTKKALKENFEEAAKERLR